MYFKQRLSPLNLYSNSNSDEFNYYNPYDSECEKKIFSDEISSIEEGNTIKKGLFSEISEAKSYGIKCNSETKFVQKEGGNNKKFKVRLQKKRGRKRNPDTKRKREHTKYSIYNIRKVINVNFLTFLIDLANDAKKSWLNDKQFKKYFFKQISHKLKSMKIGKINDLLNEKYKTIFSFVIKSDKRKKKITNYDEKEQTNDIIYNYFCQFSPKLKEFFELKISEIFNNYFCKNKNDIINNNLYFNGSEIKLSPETNTFYNLLDKKKERNLKDKYIIVANKYFHCNL